MKAVFMDRDGVINQFVMDYERMVEDTPYKPEAVRLLPRAAEGIRLLNKLQLPIIVVSNQPGIAKLKCTQQQLEVITLRIQMLLGEEGAHWDRVYYCLHHPEARLPDYRVDCDCRKPKPGLLLHAATINDIELSQSYMIGDDVTDIMAGRAAGCRTIFLGRYKCVTCRQWSKLGIRPDHIVSDLLAAAKLIQEREKNDISR